MSLKITRKVRKKYGCTYCLDYELFRKTKHTKGKCPYNDCAYKNELTKKTFEQYFKEKKKIKTF